MQPLKHDRVAVYVRVSTHDQESGIESQVRSIAQYLAGHGLTAEFYEDRLSRKNLKRPAFKRLQQDIFNGKVRMVVVWKLDRLSRSLRDGINVLTDWLEQDIRVVAVSQQLDFSGATEQLVASVLFALAQLERESIRENTKRGLAAARAKGVRLGKRPSLFAKDFVPLLQDGQSISAIARTLKCSRTAIYNTLRRENIALPK